MWLEKEYLFHQIQTPLQSKSVTALGLQTSYLVAGRGAPVILVHGAGAGAIAWFPAIHSLACHFLVIAPDVVGYGESDKPSASYSRRYFTSWLNAFCDALEVEECNLVGHSQGGAISLQFTLEHPERVTKLVLISPAALGWSFPVIGLLHGLLFHCFPSTWTSHRLHAYLVSRRSLLDENFIRYARDVCLTSGGRRAFWQGHGKSLLPFDQRQMMRIQQQTLVIWGEEDRLLPFQHGLAAAKIIPNAQFRLIPRAGHIPFFDQPDTLSAAVVDFLLKST